MTTCIYCSATENLVAQLTITLDDGNKATVDICATHADDATIRTAKQKYMERRSEIDELISRAKLLGFTLAPEKSPGGLVLMQQTNPRPDRHTGQPAADLTETIRTKSPIADDEDMVDTKVIERKERGLVSVGGVAGAHSVESHRSLDTSDVREQLGDDTLRGRVRMETVEKQSGGMVAIPVKTVNGLGTTRIRVISSTDQDLQRRFKTIAEQSKSPFGWDQMRHFGKEGIEIVNCPICKGDSVVRSGGKEITCPKCKGKGMLN